MDSFVMQTGAIYAAPVVFGPALCPVQDRDNRRYAGVLETVTRYTLAYEVDAGLLSGYLPMALELLEPFLLIRFEKLRGVQWLAGRGYHRLELLAPVRDQSDRGLFSLVIWEDNGDSIIQGRDIMGMSKVCARFSVEEDNGLRLDLRDWAFDFLRVEIDQDAPPLDEALFRRVCGNPDYRGVYHHRYVARSDAPFHQPDVEQLILRPWETVREDLYCGGSARWRSPRFADCPTQYYFLQAIARLAPKRFAGASVARFDRVEDGYGQAVVREGT